MPESVDVAALNQLVAQLSPIGVIPSGGALHAADWNLLVRAVVGLAQQLGAAPVSWPDVARASRTVEHTAEAEVSPEPLPTPEPDPGLREELERLRASMELRDAATRAALEALSERIGADGGGASSGGGVDGERLDKLQAAVEAASAQAARNLAHLDKIDARLQAIEALNASQDATLGRVAARVEALTARVDGLGGDGADAGAVTELREGLSALGAQAEATTKAVARLDASLSSLGRRVAEIESQLGIHTTELDRRFADVQKLIDRSVAPVTELGVRVTRAEADLLTLDEGVRAKVETLVGRLDSASAELGGVKTRLGSAETTLGGLNTWKTGAASSLSTLTSSLGTLDSSVRTLSTDLGGVQRSLSTVSTRVNTLDSSLSTVSTKVSALDTTMTSLASARDATDFTRIAATYPTITR